jgi:hypothetical protein
MLNFKGNYLLKLNFGLDDINIDPGNIKEFVIIQNINRYLPSFSIKLIDGEGILTHLTPFDRKLSRIHVQIGKETTDFNYNDFDFTVYRRNPVGDVGQSATYDISGFLTTDGLFAPSYCRGFSGTVLSTLNTLASNLDCSSVESSANLNFRKTLLQPNWNNSTFLDDLKCRLVGSDNESAFQIYVKRKNGKSILFCKDLKSIFKQPVSYNFIVNEEPVEDYYPALNFEVFDNYKIFSCFSSKKQRYQYFDYFNSEFKSDTLNASDMYSLSEFFLIDSDDITDSDAITDIGRITETKDLLCVKSGYYNKLNALSNMWLLTWGLPNICPGDLVRVLFAQGATTGNLQSFQYSGYWMVSRVIHTFTGTHRTRLLLTRNGVDTDQNTTLLRAENWRR